MTVITIDGPAGSGKSTVAAALAARLNLPHVDTGAFYRAATLAVLRAGANLDDGDACAAVIAASRIERDRGRTRLDGEDVEAQIRGSQVTAAVSAVSAYPQVRAALLDIQRVQVGPSGAVVEGRDAGTVVVPDADLKVWLTASARTRAARRAAQIGSADESAIDAHGIDIARRDAHDAPQMRAAEDAVEIDTTGRSIGSLVDELADLAAATR